MFFTIGVAYSLEVFIASAFNDSLHLVTTDHGSKVRLMEVHNLKKGRDYDIFNIEGNRTRILQGNKMICGVPYSNSAITCSTQIEKFSFDIRQTDDGINLVTDYDLCLTKSGFDGVKNGYHVTLEPCNNIYHQQFIILPASHNNVKSRTGRFGDMSSYGFGSGNSLTKNYNFYPMNNSDMFYNESGNLLHNGSNSLHNRMNFLQDGLDYIPPN